MTPAAVSNPPLRTCPICGRRRDQDRPLCRHHWAVAPASLVLRFLEVLATERYDVERPSARIRSAATMIVDTVCDVIGRAPRVTINPCALTPASRGSLPAGGRA